MPRKNTNTIHFLNFEHHCAEHFTSRFLCAFRLLKFLQNFKIFSARKFTKFKAGHYNNNKPISPKDFDLVVVVINTARVKDPPRRMAELGDPKWKGRIAVANPLFGTTAAQVYSGTGVTVACFTAFSASGLGQVGEQLVEQLAAFQQSVLVALVKRREAVDLRRRGAEAIEHQIDMPGHEILQGGACAAIGNM